AAGHQRDGRTWRGAPASAPAAPRHGQPRARARPRPNPNGVPSDECHRRMLATGPAEKDRDRAESCPMTMHLADTATTPKAGIVLSGLTKTFRTGGDAVPAVRGVDIAIAPGETVALLGPNGAGKSTTIDMMLGPLGPDSGSVAL